ncbi:MAG: hypothetical protein JST42_28690 [Bacteroidetes bacterium]|nr:hypothetical protein [Bacteroidota bacterium]
MYSPLPLLSRGLLEDELKKGKRWFVRQTYTRGMTANLRAAIMIRSYPAEEEAAARTHLEAIEKDKHAFLYDATLQEHLDRLTIAARQPTGYRVFYAARKGVEWKPPDHYQQKMRQYIRTHHPAWIPQKAGEKIEIGLFEEFGQFFLKFTYDGEDDTIPFDLIEKF